MSIIINGERSFINLPMKVKPEEFNRKRQPKYIQDYLSEMRIKANEVITDMIRNNVPLTTENLRDWFKNGGVKTYTCEDLFNDYLSLLHKRVGQDLTQSAYRKYELTSEIFYKYIPKTREVSTLLPMDIENIYGELRKTYQPNSSASYMAKIKTVIQFAIDNGKLNINPFQSVRIKREHKEIEYLTEEEIEKIRTTTMSTEALERIKDTFLLQVYCGLAYVDMEGLRENDIQHTDEGVYYISKERVKTKIHYTAVIFPEGVELLEKYNYRMPIISNQKTNSGLKAVARECGIDKRVYTHLGRKTYGNLLLNGYKGSKPVSLEITARALGHANAKTTARYYASVHEETVLNEFAQSFR